MVFAPFFASATIAPRIKAGFTLALTLLLCPVVTLNSTPLSGPRAWQVVAGEFVIGLIMGLTLQFVFEGVQLAGQIVGFQVGHSLANLINPQSDVETTILSNLYQTVAVLIFLALNVHDWILRGLAKSFTYCPPGTCVLTPAAVEDLWRAAGGMLVVAIQIAMPAILATIVIDVTLGFLGKASPHLPVMFVGMSIKSVAAFLVIVGALRFWPGLLERYFGAALVTSERLLHLTQ
jgi:flagellar biosynthetic protein FliR